MKKIAHKKTVKDAVPTKKHFLLSPSAAHRWFPCAGEPALRALAPRTTTRYADEGTTAHWVSEQCLNAKKPALQDPNSYVGMKCPETGMVVPEDMPEFVGIYLEECRNYMEIATECGVETQFVMPAIHRELGGTCDFWAYHGDTRALYVRDLKYGQGYVVSPEDNPQLMIYAAGAALQLCAIQKNWKVEEVIDCVDFGIVQPRTGNDAVRAVEISGQELAAWMYGTLRERAKATDQKNAPLVAGDHCQYCPAIATCPAHAVRAAELAKADFSPTAVLPNVADFSIERLALVAQAAPIFATWAASAKEELFRRLCNGETHPDWKIVSGKRGNREWKNPVEAEEKLQNLLGDQAWEKKLLSPAKVEKILKPHGLGIPSGMVWQADGSPTLAPATDNRQALGNTAEEDFTEIK